MGPGKFLSLTGDPLQVQPRNTLYSLQDLYATYASYFPARNRSLKFRLSGQPPIRLKLNSRGQPVWTLRPARMVIYVIVRLAEVYSTSI